MITVYAPGLTVEVFDKVTEPVPPPVGTLAWSRIDVGGGATGAYFRRPVVIGGGDIWAAWGPNSSTDGSHIFSRATGQWVLTSTTPGVGFDIGARENYGACFDASRNCVWIGAGTPVAYGQTGDLKFDVAAKAYTQGYTPLIAADSAIEYFGNALYAWGGWSNNYPRKRDLATGAITALGDSPRPQFTRQSQYGAAEQESPRLTYARSGTRADGTLWTLANDNELWTRAVDGVWTQRPTTGSKPTTLGIVAAVVDARNTLVAWCGKTGMVAASSGTTLRQTWLLDLTTMVWRAGPSLAAGDVVPTGVVMAGSNLLADGASALLVVDTTAGAEVWRLAWGSP